MTRTANVLLFIDIDGVLNIFHPETNSADLVRLDRLQVAPIPMWKLLLHEIDKDPQLDPHWLTAWMNSAHHWNDATLTKRWPVTGAYNHKRAFRIVPDAFGPDPGLADWKFVAVRYTIRRYQLTKRPVVWIEDGFGPLTKAYAATQPHWTLVDTTEDTVRQALLHAPATDEGARAFIATHLKGKQ